MFSTTLAIALNLALLTFPTSAAPLEARQSLELIPGIERHDLCPVGMQYRAAGACGSKFTGCARPEDFDTCSGNNGFSDLYKKCGRSEYGTWRSCPSNGFYGCSVEDICNIPAPGFKATPTIPGVVRADLCPAGYTYRKPGECKSGYVGCIPSDDHFGICGFEAPNPIFLGTCYRPEFGRYRTCDNGFYGCHLDENVCSSPKLQPTPPVTPSNPTDPLAKYCPAGMQYYKNKECSSGFVGCGSVAQCSGSQRFYWGDCPAGTGVFYVCGNNFRGCTTVSNPCQ
jgi:hypothetical protein